MPAVKNFNVKENILRCAEEKIVDNLTSIARQLAIKKLLKIKLHACYYDPSSPVRINIGNSIFTKHENAFC